MQLSLPDPPPDADEQEQLGAGVGPAKGATNPLPIAPIRWGRELGWLAIWDPGLRLWHEVRARDVPDHWRWIARQAKRGARAA